MPNNNTSTSTYASTSLNNLHNKVKLMFNNPNINFFIIMCLILIISCYSLINTPLRFAISSFISNPVIILIGLIIVIFMGFYNINIAILILLLLFIMLFGATLFNKKTNLTYTNFNSIENFTDEQNLDYNSIEDEEGKGNDGEENEEEEDKEEGNEGNEGNEGGNNSVQTDTKKYLQTVKKYKKSRTQIKEEEDKNTDEKISNIKNVILGTINRFKDVSDNDYKKGLLENKQIVLNNAKKMNNINNKKNYKNTKNNSKFSKENFKTVDLRKFDPSKEEDTNLLITKEILTDMNNRIEFNYETNKYLKKYLKHRIEEIVDLNKLLEDSD